MDEKKRIHISVIDICIIAVVIACVAFLVIKLGALDRIKSIGKEESARIVFVCENLTENQAKEIKSDTPIYMGSVRIGAITGSIASKQSIIYTEGTDGRYIPTVSSENIDIRGAISIKLCKTDSGYLLSGNKYIAPGSVLTIRCGSTDAKITILTIEMDEKE